MVASTLEFAGPAAEELWGWLDGSIKPPDEAICEGPAGTGKTHNILWFCRAYCEENEGVRVLFMRDHRVDMTSTVLVEWEEAVLGVDHPAVLDGPTRGHRDVYRFPNGSEIILGGFNNATKLFSGQYHGIYFNECQQTSEAKWETLHRALRAKGGPFRFLIGDCNPEHEGHWLNQRCARGVTKRLQSRLWHNPRFFRDGEWTPDGIEYAQRMRKNLSGVNFRRLYLGEWTTATGLVWPEYDRERHLIHADVARRGSTWWLTGQDEKGTKHDTELRWFVLGIDHGTTAPGCLQLYGVTPTGVMYRIVEYYHTGWTHADWIARAMPLIREYRPFAMVSDHDKAFIMAMNRALMDAGMNPICTLADKTLGMPGREGKKARIEMMRNRWQSSRMFLVRGALREPDPTRREGLPKCFEDEIPAWRRVEFERGEDAMLRADDPDPNADDHACDTAMYCEAYVWGKQVEPPPVDRSFQPGTYGRMLKHPERAKERGLWK